MKLKTRLGIAFCIIIFIPVICFSIFVVIAQSVQLDEIKEVYGVEDTAYSYLTNSFQFLYNVTKDEYSELRGIISEAEESDDYTVVSSENFYEEFNERLTQKCSFLLVTKNERVIYSGVDDEYRIPSNLPRYETATNKEQWNTYWDTDVSALIKQLDFHFSDGSFGSFFIVTTSIQALPQWREMVLNIVLCVAVILFLTAAMLSIWLYQAIVNPISKLQSATQYIKEGNLDFTIDIGTNDEIGDLSRSFEDMRQKLKETSEEKILAEKENKELIRNISHDLKTPITSIKGYAEGIMDGVADTPEKREKYLKTIYNKAVEMTTLINELTLYAQIDTNRIPYNFVKLNVSAYFNDCVEEIGMDLETKNIGLAYFNYVENEVDVIADPEQLTRVVHNIINNSVKYIDKTKGFINIRIKDVGDYAQIEIEDNGKGIAARDLPYIFDRFYRTDESRNSNTGGSGIGLSIVKKIIEDHGGKIWATSKLATGTTMYFVLRKYQEVPNEQTIDH